VAALKPSGEKAFGYRAAKIDEFISDGQMLPFWGGLQVVHLRGTRWVTADFSVRATTCFLVVTCLRAIFSTRTSRRHLEQRA